MGKKKKSSKTITPQQAVDAVEQLKQEGKAPDVERQVERAKNIITKLEKRSGVAATEAQRDRIEATVYKRTLSSAEMPEHAKALEDWVTLGRVHDAVEKELAEPKQQPLLSKLKAESPDTLKHLLEEVPHGDHSHTNVHTRVKLCLNDLDISHTQVDENIMPAAENALNHLRATRRSKGTLAEPTSSTSTTSSGYSGYSGGHSCGLGCTHGSHSTSTSGSGGLHYHGDTPCYHNHGEPHISETTLHGGWLAAGIVALGVGAYLINEYGKSKMKENASKSGNWKARTQGSTTSEARAL